MIIIDVCVTRTKGVIAPTATMFAEGESFAMPMPPIVDEGTGAAYCAAKMAERVGVHGHFVTVEQDTDKGHYRFAMVTGPWSF